MRKVGGGKGDGTRRCGDPRCRRHWTRALSRPQPPPRREDDQKGPVRWVRREARHRGGRDGKLRRGAERRLGPPPHIAANTDEDALRVQAAIPDCRTVVVESGRDIHQEGPNISCGPSTRRADRRRHGECAIVRPPQGGGRPCALSNPRGLIRTGLVGLSIASSN